MGFKKVAELVIQGVEDRLTVSSILIKNGYTVGPDKRKRTPTGKTLDYLLNVYEEDSGAMTGGEGVYDIHDYGSLTAGGFIPPYRTAEELLTEPEDMTDKERKRLERIKAIPESVRELCQTEVANLRSQVMELEKRSDEIIDFLNGEAV